MPLDTILTLKGGYKVLQDPQDLQTILGQGDIGTVEQLQRNHWVLWAPDERSFWQFVRILESDLEDGNRYDYSHINGQLIMSPARSSHSLIILFLMALITRLSPSHVGRMEFRLKLKGWTKVLTPDVAILSLEQDERYDPNQDPFTEMPLVVIEVLSSSTRIDNVEWKVGSQPSKLTHFVEAGIEEYWIVDPEQKKLRIFSKPELLDARAAQAALRFHQGSPDIVSTAMPDFKISAEAFWQLFNNFSQRPQIKY